MSSRCIKRRRRTTQNTNIQKTHEQQSTNQHKIRISRKRMNCSRCIKRRRLTNTIQISSWYKYNDCHKIMIMITIIITSGIDIMLLFDGCKMAFPRGDKVLFGTRNKIQNASRTTSLLLASHTKQHNNK